MTKKRRRDGNPARSLGWTVTRMLMDDSMSMAEILEVAREYFPAKDVTMSKIEWYRAKLVAEGWCLLEPCELEELAALQNKIASRQGWHILQTAESEPEALRRFWDSRPTLRLAFDSFELWLEALGAGREV